MVASAIRMNEHLPSAARHHTGFVVLAPDLKRFIRLRVPGQSDAVVVGFAPPATVSLSIAYIY